MSENRKEDNILSEENESNPEFNYWHTNMDFTGIRKVQGSHELVEFRAKSMHRIWMNDLMVPFEAHWHSALEIIVPSENYYEVIVEGTLYHLEPDEILIIPPGDIHEILMPPKGIRFIYMLNITPISKLRSFSGIQPILSSPLYMTPETYSKVYDDVYNILLQIRSEYFNENAFAELTIQSLLLNMFVKLGENRSLDQDLFSRSTPPLKQHDYIQRFNAALEYIDANYTEDITLEFLAGQIGFSKHHFSRLFKQYTNYNFSDYLCLRRIKAAEDLLGDTNYTITEVALNSGFTSISTFNRIFKLKKGVTPSEYRKRCSARPS